jgi:hypothetical protein
VHPVLLFLLLLLLVLLVLQLLSRELQISVGTALSQTPETMSDKMPERMSEYRCQDRMPKRTSE